MLTFTCAGCGAALPADPGRLPCACPRAKAGDDIDHVVRALVAPACPFPGAGDPNPFLRYRGMLASHALAMSAGFGDEAFVRLVRDLDDAVVRVDGRGFHDTPFEPSAALADRVGFRTGELWVKDETGHVAGSHKARHLFGIMLSLALRPDDPSSRAGVRRDVARPPLAIASCGNAALAAGVVARAAGWPLEVFVPGSASEEVLGRLRRLSASVHVCERRPGVAGDPCYLSFREAVALGAVPFCCQGSDNGLTIDGGKTLAWEMVSGVGRRPRTEWGADRLDALFVQVGGGALASAVIQGFDDAVRAGGLDGSPRLYTVQTTGAYPLKRAYDAVAERVLARAPLVLDRGFSPAADRERAELMTDHPDIIDEEMHHARTHRSRFMRPWEKPPRSIADGILDDETYDWATVVEGMLKTGGWPLVVGDDRLAEANAVARETTGIDVGHTGSAGVAGLMKALPLDARLASERVAVIFSGVRR